MKLSEMKNCFIETLNYFIEVMPNVPFTAGDVIIEFAPRTQMAERAAILCDQYAPGKPIGYYEAQRLAQYASANSIIGYEKSAVLAFRDYKASAQEWHKIFFHELTHIFCAKVEVEGEHFMDVYGAGPTANTDNEALTIGYFVWAEFIAHYYSLTKPLDREITTVASETAYIKWLLSKVKLSCMDISKGAFSMACAQLLTCSDAEDILSRDCLLTASARELCVRREFWDCLLYLHRHMKREKPWKISEDVIFELWECFSKFRKANSGGKSVLSLVPGEL